MPTEAERHAVASVCPACAQLAAAVEGLSDRELLVMILGQLNDMGGLIAKYEPMLQKFESTAAGPLMWAARRGRGRTASNGHQATD